MRIVLGADHAGFELKELLKRSVAELGHSALDIGTQSTAPVDYPDIAAALGRVIQAGEADRGVLVCGSGVGAAVAANKLRGIRAAVCHDGYSAHQGVEHDDLNVLCLGARIIGVELARELLRTFLAARFSRAERHQRRLDKILALEHQLSGHA
ncbi:MAG TPA: ribose 5-phosphate isomerase B [Acidobacteriota bacterium]